MPPVGWIAKRTARHLHVRQAQLAIRRTAAAFGTASFSGLLPPYRAMPKDATIHTGLEASRET